MAANPYSFIFDASRGDTPQTLAAKRALAEAIIRGASTGPAKDIGSGIQSLANGIVAGVERGRIADLDRQQAAGEAGAAQSFQGLFPGIFSGSSAPIDMGTTGSIDGSGSYRDAIAGIESGGNYQAIGPTDPKLGRALGKYQVMEANVGPWSEQVLGRRLSADEFLASPEAQDAIFDGIFGGYVKQFGPEGAAQAWFGGPGSVGKTNRKDVLGTDVGSYGRKFMSAIGKGGQEESAWYSVPPDQTGLEDITAPKGDRVAGLYVGTPSEMATDRVKRAFEAQEQPMPDPQTTEATQAGPQVALPYTPASAPLKSIDGTDIEPTSPILRAIAGLSGPDTASLGGPYPATPQMPAEQAMQQVASMSAPQAQNAPSEPAGGFPAPNASFPPAPAHPGSAQARVQQLAQVLSNPFLSKEARAVAQQLFEAEMAQNAPGSDLDRRYKQAQIANMESQIAERNDPNARNTFGNSVIWGQKENGDWVAMQPSSGGGLVPANVDPGIKLSPPGVGNLNLGTSYGIRDRAGNIINNVPIDNAGKAAQQAAGKGQGEAIESYNSMTSKMPGLENVVGQLDQLSNQATYTWTGQINDNVRRQLGAEPRESAVARQKYISMVDNQILPLLRDTFGAQFTQAEGESLRSTLGNPDLHPKEKQAVLKAFIEQKRRDIEALAQRTGLTPAPADNDPLGIR